MNSSSTTKFTVVSSPSHRLRFKATSLIFTALCLSTFLSATVASADQSARQLFETVRAKYAKLNSYSHSTTSVSTSDSKVTSQSNATLSFAVPNRLAIKVESAGGVSTFVSNGRTFYQHTPSDEKKVYYAVPMPDPSLGRVGLMQNRIGGGQILPFLASIDPFAAPWGQQPLSLKKGKQTVINGAVVDVIQAQIDESSLRTYYVGQKDHLIRRIQLAGGSGSDKYSYTETYSNIRQNPRIPIHTFTFNPPPGTRQMSEEAALREFYELPETVAIGKEAPGVVGKDLSGKTVSLKDYRGKVVLLDFWATWCGPCLVELPHIQAAYRKYHEQGFDVLGVSLDQQKGKLSKFIEQKKMPWTQLFDGQMWDSAMLTNYNIQGIPFAVLIDREGKIAAINPKSLLLDAAIEKALQQNANP
jgi:outer membrane lipoprotein-sorting protein/peroxiredoxin